MWIYISYRLIKFEKEVFSRMVHQCKEVSTSQGIYVPFSKNKKRKVLPSSVKRVTFSQYSDTLKKLSTVFNIIDTLRFLVYNRHVTFPNIFEIRYPSLETLYFPGLDMVFFLEFDTLRFPGLFTLHFQGLDTLPFPGFHTLSFPALDTIRFPAQITLAYFPAIFSIPFGITRDTLRFPVWIFSSNVCNAV